MAIRPALMADLAGYSARAVGRHLWAEVEDFTLGAASVDQACETVSPGAAAFLADHAQYVELADEVAKGGGVVARHK